jgi:hypothetical protein
MQLLCGLALKQEDEEFNRIIVDDAQQLLVPAALFI